MLLSSSAPVRDTHAHSTPLAIPSSPSLTRRASNSRSVSTGSEFERAIGTVVAVAVAGAARPPVCDEPCSVSVSSSELVQDTMVSMGWLARGLGPELMSE